MSVILPVPPQFEGLILHTRYTLFQYLQWSHFSLQDIESNHTQIKRMKKIILHPKILNIDGESDYNISSKMSTRALKNGYIEEPVSCNFFFIFKYLTYS